MEETKHWVYLLRPRRNLSNVISNFASLFYAGLIWLFLAFLPLIPVVHEFDSIAWPKYFLGYSIHIPSISYISFMEALNNGFVWNNTLYVEWDRYATITYTADFTACVLFVVSFILIYISVIFLKYKIKETWLRKKCNNKNLKLTDIAH